MKYRFSDNLCTTFKRANKNPGLNRGWFYAFAGAQTLSPASNACLTMLAVPFPPGNATNAPGDKASIALLRIGPAALRNSFQFALTVVLLSRDDLPNLQPECQLPALLLR